MNAYFKRLYYSIVATFSLSLFGTQTSLANSSAAERKRVAVMFVAHGEPAVIDDALVPIRFWDGTALPATSPTLDVPQELQGTLMAAYYEEIATALSYMNRDLNHNGVPHELALLPKGDVPPFLTFANFRSMFEKEYAVLGGSPHNSIWKTHIDNLKFQNQSFIVDKYITYLDAAPLIGNTVGKICHDLKYETILLVPLFLGTNNTHMQEIRRVVPEWIARAGNCQELVWGPSFFENHSLRSMQVAAAVEMIKALREKLPSSVPNEEIGVVAAMHGDPFEELAPGAVPAPGEIYSDLRSTEVAFSAEIQRSLPFALALAENEFREPSIETAITSFESLGKKHILVVPGNFHTTAMHTMWDIANKAIGRPVSANEGATSIVRPSGTHVWYSPLGYGDTVRGSQLVRSSIEDAVNLALQSRF